MDPEGIVSNITLATDVSDIDLTELAADADAIAKIALNHVGKRVTLNVRGRNLTGLLVAVNKTSGQRVSLDLSTNAEGHFDVNQVQQLLENSGFFTIVDEEKIASKGSSRGSSQQSLQVVRTEETTAAKLNLLVGDCLELIDITDVQSIKIEPESYDYLVEIDDEGCFMVVLDGIPKTKFEFTATSKKLRVNAEIVGCNDIVHKISVNKVGFTPDDLRHTYDLDNIRGPVVELKAEIAVSPSGARPKIFVADVQEIDFLRTLRFKEWNRAEYYPAMVFNSGRLTTIKCLWKNNNQVTPAFLKQIIAAARW